MQTIPSDILYSEIGADNPVTHRVQPGEEFEVQTQINRGPWFDRLSKEEQQKLGKKIKGGNPSSGCVFVESAKPGDQLAVKIHSIEPAGMGYTQFGGWNWAMPGWLDIGEHMREVEIKDGLIHWSDTLKLPAKPMLGFVGVAPQRERFHNGWGGTHGGNLDAQEVAAGATLFLRVHHEGGLLHVGDMHAIQGDGEICGAGGIETGGSTRISCEVVSPAPKTHVWPRFEDETHIGVFGNARPAEDAFRYALKELLLWMRESYGMSLGEAYILLGQVLEARVTAFVNPTFTYVAKIRKEYLK